jgi:hypothetical protein
VLAVLVAFAPCGCEQRTATNAADAGAVIAAANSYLAAAAADLLDPHTPIFTLAAPGTCPGQFDLRPDQAATLRGCRLLLRFSFQAALDERVPRENNCPRIVAIAPKGGLCEPETIGDVYAQVAAALVDAGLLARATADARCAELAAGWHQDAVVTATTLRAAGMSDLRVVCSPHQAAFCRGLGLEVVATLTDADDPTPAAVQGLAQAAAGVVCIIANRPEGRGLADRLGEHLGVPVVVFDNFPARCDAGGLAELYRGNWQRLVAATTTP